MFIDNTFNNTVPAFPFPVLPPGTDPFADPQVTVCFNERWLKYVVTCLYQLVLQSTWKVESADELDIVQAQAMTLIALFIQGCNPPTNIGKAGAGDESIFMLRQNPDNPCELQSSVDGVVWCTWADLSKCTSAANQPGGGTPQPTPNGGQKCYNAAMNASEQWNVPTIVNAGDQITFSNAKGAGADGGIDGLWYCPNGQTFFAGACIGVPGTKTADIANTIAHMRLIVKIGTVWYDAYNTSFTVPGGIVNSPVIVQINDSTIADNSGSYTFDVCVTNNAQANWEHIIDFTVTDGGFVGDTSIGGVASSYVVGSGWENQPAGSGRVGGIARSLVASTITSVEFDGHSATAPDTGAGCNTRYGTANVNNVTNANTDPVWLATSTQTGVTQIRAAYGNGSTGASGAGAVVYIKRARITGTGVNPFL